MVDQLHQRGIGVIVDWVPAHFPTDGHALGYFDGTHLYEHADPRQGFHPDWNTFIFNFGRPEVANFLIANALFWVEKYHIDGLRVDAVASMLYRDYSRQAGEWVPNVHGGRENLEAIEFLKRVNEQVHAAFPGVLTIAEESTSWPMVSRPTDLTGGLGFDYKWDMGWMHDTLGIFRQGPGLSQVRAQPPHVRGLYAFTENFVLPLSHDEVVYGKGSLPEQDARRRLAKIRQRPAPVRLPVRPAGQEDALHGRRVRPVEGVESRHLARLASCLSSRCMPASSRWVRDLNTLYRGSRGTPRTRHQAPTASQWVHADDCRAERPQPGSAKATRPDDLILFVANFTPVPRHNYRVGVPRGSATGGRSSTPTPRSTAAAAWATSAAPRPLPVGAHGHGQSLNLTLPPLADRSR